MFWADMFMYISFIYAHQHLYIEDLLIVPMQAKYQAVDNSNGSLTRSSSFPKELKRGPLFTCLLSPIKDNTLDRGIYQLNTAYLLLFGLFPEQQ